MRQERQGTGKHTGKDTGKGKGTAAVIGAGPCGRMTAQRIAESDLFDTVVLTDVIDGLAEGIALDINQSRPIVGFETTMAGRTTRTADAAGAIAGAEVVVLAAGAPPDPSGGRPVRENGRIVREAAETIARHAPDAVVIVMTDPVDVMTALAGEATGFHPSRVLGQSVLLDAARFADFVAGPLAVPRSVVAAVTVGSHAHGDAMVPLLSTATVAGTPLTSLLDPARLAEAVAATRRGGSDVARLTGGHSSFHAPSAAAARMVRAVKEDDGTVLPVCAFVDGPYGIRGVWIGVPARLGRKGVLDVVELPLDEAEYGALADAARVLRAAQDQARTAVFDQRRTEGGTA
ncbi:hypothetical protein ABZZ17_31520 [Streptomyces sp. NPDC006512]|uniref:lactate/malate family dehydrogenase n=1 Tax=Streptomyces sp. NPDC006512 TaxID=3154307 RepID=UPI0033B1491D